MSIRTNIQIGELIMSKNLTQEQMAELWMRVNGPLSGAEAFTSMGIMHLPKRINNLRAAHGTDYISDKWVKSINRYGQPTKHKIYWITELDTAKETAII
jgi:hypothetical protein